MKNRLTFLLLLLTILGYSQTIRLPLDDDSTTHPFSLDPYTSIYATDHEDLGISDISQIEWSPYPQGPTIGIADKYYWIKYTFNNSDTVSHRYVLFIPYHHIYRIDIWIKNGDTHKIKTTGTAFTEKRKDYQSRGYPINISFPPGESKIVIRLQHLYMPLRSSAYLLKPSEMNKLSLRSESIIWFWRGIFMFALVVSFVLYVTTKTRLFLHYFLLNLGVAIFIGMEIGDFFMFFPSDPYKFIIDIKHLGNVLVVLFFPLFLNELTPIKIRHPKLWQWMLYGTAFMAVLWSLCLIPTLKNSYFLYLTVVYFIFYTSLVFVLQIYFLVSAYMHRQRNALILLITYFFYIAAVTINVILPNLGFKSDSVLVYNTLMLGSIVEIFTFMILMGKETLSIYRERSALLEKQKQHQSEIIKAMVESQEIERNKVGRELHDMIGANISVIRQNVDKANKQLVSVIDHTIESVRRLSHGLVTPLIKRDEFKDEIDDLCLAFSTDHCDIRAQFHNWQGLYKPEVATHLYRIVQELLQNAAKHSWAQNINIQFLVDADDILTMIYEDDGIGFDYETKRKSGLGLINIENRVKLIKGKLSFDTQQGGKGTTVIVEL